MKGVERHGKKWRVPLEIKGRPKQWGVWDHEPTAREIKIWKADARALFRQSGDQETDDTSLGAGVTRWLDSLPDGQRKKDEQRRLAHVLASPIARFPMWSLTVLDIKTVFAKAIDAGISASYANRIIDTLRLVYRDTKKPKGADNPMAGYEGVKHFRVDKRVPGGRAIPYAWIEAILAKMGPSIAREQCRLMAYTGMPFEQQYGINPKTDIRWTTRPVLLRWQPRRKGKGVEARWVQCNRDGVAALNAFVAAGAHVRMSKDSRRKSFLLACGKIVADQIAAGQDDVMPHRMEDDRIVCTVRPYDLRHSFITEALKRSNGNIKGVAYLCGHSTTRQTEGYSEGAEMHEGTIVANSWDSKQPRKADVVTMPTKKRKRA